MDIKMIIKKLTYENKQQALQDLMSKGVILNRKFYDDDGNEIDLQPTPKTDVVDAIVYVGQINDTYNVDLMLKENIDFENETNPNTPSHMFFFGILTGKS